MTLLPGMTQYDVLVAIRDEGKLTQAAISDWLGLSRPVVSRHIVGLQKAGLIELSTTLPRRPGCVGRLACTYRATLAAVQISDPGRLLATQETLKRLTALEFRVRQLESTRAK